MNSEQLIAEAQRLVRPCVHLTQNNTGASLAAVWGGSGLIAHSALKSSFHHLLSIDCRFMPHGYDHLTGCLSVYVGDDEDFDEGEENGTVATDPLIQLASSSSSGLELFAHSGSSWPPIDAIFRFGSPAVQEWTAQCGWKPEWLYNDNFKGHDVVRAYEEHVRDHNPLFGAMDDVFARLGGWHESWPENDWADLLDKKLVVFTYQDAEPWFEVWVEGNQSFQVIQRIS